MKSLLFTLSFFITASLIIAQSEPADTLYYDLDSVVVSSTRYEQPVSSAPFSIDIIQTGDQPVIGGGLSTGNLLSVVPGVIVNDRTNLSQGDRILIRGIGSRAQFGVRGIKIFLDGIPLTFPDGQSQLNNLDIHTLNKVEVISGPGSVLYGNSAGGVIDFTSKTNKNGFNIVPSFYYGSYGYNKIILQSSGKIAGSDFNLSINRLHYDGFREHSNAESYNGNLIVAGEINDKINLKGIINYYDAPFLLNPSSLTKEDAVNHPKKAREFIKSQGAGKEVAQLQSGLNLEYNISGSEKFNTILYGISRDLLNAIPGRIIELKRLAGGLRSQYSSRYKLFRNKLSFVTGFDYEFMIDDRIEFENSGRGAEERISYSPADHMKNLNYGNELLNQEESVQGFGLFIKSDYQLFSSLSVAAGGRYDIYTFSVSDKYFEDGADNSAERNISNFSSTAGLIYRPNLTTSIYFNYSNAFQTPTTNELSNTPDNTGGFNSNLEPEKINSFETGIRGILFNTSYFNITLFTMTMNNMLIPYQVQSPGSEEIYYRNAGQSRNRGLEAKFQWKPAGHFDFLFSFTYMDFQFTDYITEADVDGTTRLFQLGGNKIPGVPQFNFVSNLIYEFPAGINTGIRFNYTGDFYANDFNGPPPGIEGVPNNYINDSYFTLDLLLGYFIDFEKAELVFTAGINNLFDKRYNGSIVPNAFGERYFEPAVDRNYYINLSLKFLGQ